MKEYLRYLRRYQFTFLLISLLLHILLIPVFASLSNENYPNIGIIAMSFSVTLLMFAAILTTSTSRLTTLFAFSLMVPALILTWTSIGVFEVDWKYFLEQALVVSFLSTVTISIMKHIFRSKKVSLDLINASLCVYLIIGILWVSLYSIVEGVQPNSFNLPNDGLVGEFIADDSSGDLLIRRLYYSFITLSTLGYGDIIPINPVARLLSIIEALIGQIFLVVLVARLVGVHVAQSIEE